MTSRWFDLTRLGRRVELLGCSAQWAWFYGIRGAQTSCHFIAVDLHGAGVGPMHAVPWRVPAPHASTTSTGLVFQQDDSVTHIGNLGHTCSVPASTLLGACNEYVLLLREEWIEVWPPDLAHGATHRAPSYGAVRSVAVSKGEALIAHDRGLLRWRPSGPGFEFERDPTDLEVFGGESVMVARRHARTTEITGPNWRHSVDGTVLVAHAGGQGGVAVTRVDDVLHAVFMGTEIDTFRLGPGWMKMAVATASASSLAVVWPQGAITLRHGRYHGVELSGHDYTACFQQDTLLISDWLALFAGSGPSYRASSLEIPGERTLYKGGKVHEANQGGLGFFHSRLGSIRAYNYSPDRLQIGDDVDIQVLDTQIGVSVVGWQPTNGDGLIGPSDQELESLDVHALRV